VRLINDLEALAYAVPQLGPDELITINEGSAVANGNIAVLAPGTGLGEAFLTHDGDRYVSHASEGGHADFAPTNALQIELLQYLLPKFDHVSFERVCSGIGLPNIYDFLRESGHGSETASVAARLSDLDAAAKAHVIVDAAFDQNEPCPLCLDTLDLFSKILAAEAGNLALKVMATGGIYLAGGIATHVVPKLQPAFEEAFGHKGRFSELLKRIPVKVITVQAALLGAATYGLNPPMR
jgi:glucokinase